MTPPRAAALALGLAGMLPAAPTASSAPRHASLALESERPVVVRGHRFVAHELVHVRLSRGETWARLARADAVGRFRARFDIGIPRCTRYTVRAWGSHGSRAVLHMRVARDCAPDS